MENCHYCMIRFSRLVPEKPVPTNNNVICCDIRYFWIKTYRQLQMDPNHSCCKPINYNLGQTIWNKLENPVKFDRTRRFSYLLLRVFWLLLLNLIPGREIGSTDVSTQIWYYVRQLVYQVCYARYRVSFYLWRLVPVLKHFKVLKYCEQDFLDYLHFQWLFIFLERVIIWLKMLLLLKTPNNQNRKLSKSKFWPEPNMEQSAYRKSLNLES